VDFDTCWKYNTIYNCIKRVVSTPFEGQNCGKVFPNFSLTFPNFSKLFDNFQTLWKKVWKKMVVSQEFYRGPDAIIGTPNPRVMEGLRAEHCRVEFTTPNYNLTTTPNNE
jgi:hypothetical protein